MIILIKSSANMGGNIRKSHTLNSNGRSKSKYCGNRYSKTMSDVTGLDDESDVEKQPTTHTIYGTFNTPNDGNGFKIVDFDILSSVISQCTCCMPCHSQTLLVKESLRRRGCPITFNYVVQLVNLAMSFILQVIIQPNICNFNVHNKYKDPLNEINDNYHNQNICLNIELLWTIHAV